MNKLPNVFIYGTIFFLITGCVTNQHDITGSQSGQDLNVNTGVLLRQYQEIQKRALIDADYHCKYSKLAQSYFHRNIIDPSLFQDAYQITQPYKVIEHLYTTGQAQGLLQSKEYFLKRIAELQKMGGNQRAIQEARQEIASIDQLLATTHLSQAFLEHQESEKKWIDSGIMRTTLLDDTDVIYQALAELDVDLAHYSQMCSDWRPYYYGSKNSFPITNEKNYIAQLRKAVEDKMYRIITSGNSSIADRIAAINSSRDVGRFFSTYIILNGGSSTKALMRSGLYDEYKHKNNMARDREKNRY